MNRNLDKEKFWDVMMQICPLAMKHFCEWIDQYKESSGWYTIFAKPLSEAEQRSITEMWQAVSDIPHHDDNEEDRSSAYDQAVAVEAKMHRDKCPKFHDLPYEMQLGILQRYLWEMDIKKEVAVEHKTFKEVFEAGAHTLILEFGKNELFFESQKGGTGNE